MQHFLTQYLRSSEAFVSALDACHQAITPETVTQLEASQDRYRLQAQRLEGASMELHPLERMGVEALLQAQVGASLGICWGFRSRLNRQDAEAAALAGDHAGAAKLEAEAEILRQKILDIADDVFNASELSVVAGMMMPMGAEVAA